MTEYTSKYDIWQKIQEKAYPITTNDNLTEKGLTLTDIMQILQKVPSADVQPVIHGTWLNDSAWFENCGERRYKCSCCGYIVWGKPQSRKDGKGGKFCDECGSQMSGVENE